MRENRSSTPRLGAAALILVLAIGLALRLYQIGDQILLDDELHAVAKLATSTYPEILLSFGVVDHSIPLTLFFKWLAEQGRLSEAWMLGLPWLLGTGAWLFCVGIARRAATPLAAGMFAALLAISPLLVLFTRQARPYAITLFLVLVALWAAYRWIEERKARHAAIYIASAVLAVYLHLIVAPVALGVWVYFAADWAMGDRRDRKRLVSIVLMGAATAALAAVPLVPPLLHDWQSLRVKAGHDFPTIDTLARTLLMMTGTTSAALAALMTLLALVGAYVLWKAFPRPARYVSFVLALQLAAVLASGALWLNHPFVLTRYLLVFLPFLLLATAVGFARLATRWLSQRMAAVPGALLIVACFFTGPLPGVLGHPNAFVEHQMYSQDFDLAHNKLLPYLMAGPIPSFYRDLGRLPPRSKVVIEAPWRFESMFNRLPVFQEVHRQRVEIGMVGGLCPPGAFMEFPRSFRNKFRHFVDLSRPADELRRTGDFVVFHRALEMANMTEPWQAQDGKVLAPVAGCIEKFRRSFGPPVFEDETITVFALRP